ncbi:unnamed protein product [Mytilus edulis]|uniref:ATP-dependent DNA helicase n=1 Tax=Mytilus edulis TaxID=6550 RepID=A0A8S3PTC0_MYTED|nr:unnamed protein product [Mytilus edulis]
MDEDQKLAFELATSGHNFVISGQAGTGKTFLVKKLVHYMRFKQGKNVSIVCSTGIAATHYGDLRAQTLHKWSGVEDGRHLNEEIIHFVKTDERFTVAKHNIETVETLIIDESSMISAKIFNQVQVLFNGLCGTVTKLNTDSVEVKFTLEHKALTVTIAKEVLTTFDPVEKIVLAKRVQLPFKVGFAITIHKAQGMTIENLVVDCNNSIQPGQLGVAIGGQFLYKELLPDKSGSRLALDTVLKRFTDTPVEANILVFSVAISKNYQHFHDWFQAQCSIMEDIGKETDLARYQFEMDIFNSLTCSYDELNMSTTEGDTLLETKRKQNERESLTNVSDVTFNFFQKLEIVCREKFTHS